MLGGVVDAKLLIVINFVCGDKFFDLHKTRLRLYNCVFFLDVDVLFEYGASTIVHRRAYETCSMK
jgi:hypothetical protein